MTDEFSALQGQIVHSWRGTEMCVRGGEDGVPPVFTDPAMRCLQLWTLHARMDRTTLAVVTYQGREDWGLCLQPDPAPLRDGANGILRTRDLTELPTGRIASVAVLRERGELAEVALRIGGHDLLLVAGESYEEWDGTVTWRRLDESVLVFTEPAEAATGWIEPPVPSGF